MSQANVYETKYCYICDEKFTAHRCKQQICCSNKCRHKWQGIILSRKIYKHCKQCKKDFIVTPSKRKQAFCCLQCFWDWQNQNKPKCKVCNKLTKTNKSTYCSKKCMSTDYTTRMLKENNPNWKENNIKRANSGISQTQRDRILKRDNYKCTKCGMQDWDLSPSLLHMHHIEQYKENFNNSDNNIITLCFVCHWVGKHGYKINKSLQEIASKQGCRSKYCSASS
jgi:hypothetical protein